MLTVLPGVRNRTDLEKALACLDAPAEERDHSVISQFTPQNADGICVYCNHCQPRCPFHVQQEARMKEIAAYFRK